MDAKEMAILKEQDPDQFSARLDSLNFQSYHMNLRTKNEIHEDQARLKSTVAKIEAIDYSRDSREIIDAIKKY
jgi:hypothetical protein